MNRVRKCLAIASIIIGGTSIAIPDPTLAKVGMALATSLNAASLYLMKEEAEDVGSGTAAPN